MKKNRIWQVVAILAACAAFGCGSADDESRAGIEKAADNAVADVKKAGLTAEELARTGAAARAARDALAAERGVANDVAAHGVEGAVEDAAKTLEENVERSARIDKENYDAARAEGEGVVDAAGDAYDTVIDEAEVKDRDE